MGQHHVSLVALFTVLLLFIGLSHGNDVIVEINDGSLLGRSFTLHNGKTVNRFFGIPYAAPPVGDLRWQPPADPAPWDEVLDTNSLPAACPQTRWTFLLTHPLFNKFTEDCLTLNVFAPNDTSNGPYPVMFWIHGGAFQSSGSVQYPGYFQASRDVVSVIINYRLGHLGFMTTEDSTAPGNYGLLDQIKALQWVKNNIAKFGGDPGRVTVFGQSAGAASVSILTLSPQAEGLFHQVIAQSGSDLAAWAVLTPGHQPADYTRQVAAQLDCPTNDSKAMMDCMRQIDANTLRNTPFDCRPGFYCLGFVPVVDGDVLPDVPRAMRMRGEYAKLPLMNGMTTEDGALYTVGLLPGSLLGGYTREEFEEAMRYDLLSIFSPLFPEREEEVFEAFNFYYSPWPYINDEDANRQGFNDMITDFAFGAPGDEQNSFVSNDTDVYYYLLGYKSKQAEGILPEWMGVFHMLDLPYVFGYPLIQLNPEVRADSRVIDFLPWDEEDIEWAEYGITLWTNFAKYGNPTPEPVPAPGNNGPTTWPKWTNDNKSYLQLDRQVEELKDYRQRDFAFWYNYMSYVADIELPGTKHKTGGRLLKSNDMVNHLDSFYRNVLINHH